MKKIHRSRVGWRNIIAALLALYYLLCIFCLYEAFFSPLPVPEGLHSYTGVLGEWEQVSSRFGGDNVRLLFNDRTKIMMDESFTAADARKIRSGDVLTVQFEASSMLTNSIQGCAVHRGGEEIHSLQATLERMAREQKFNRILSIVLVLVPPVISACGLLWERRVLGEANTGKV